MKLREIREKYLPYNELTLKRLAIAATVMYLWILIWALVFKLGNGSMLVNNYINLKDMTLQERILWDIVPFNYRGDGVYKAQLIMDTLLNCFVFAPFGVAFGYLFKKANALRDVSLCLAFSVFIEVIQLVTMLGNPATEDLITNVFGYFVGFAAYRLLFMRLSEKHSVRLLAIVNCIFAATVIASAVTMLVSVDTIYQIISKTL